MREEGLDVDLEGIWIDNRIFFPIGAAALAYCSSISEKAFQKKLKEYFPSIEINVPSNLLIPLNKREQYVGLSKKNLLSSKVKSRSKNHDFYAVSIGEATIRHVGDLSKIYFDGGTIFTEKRLRRGNHWTSGENGLTSERTFLDDIVRETGNKKIIEDYTAQIKIADFTHYLTLITAHKILKYNKINRAYGFKNNKQYTIALPYDFDKNPELAIKAAVMKYFEKKSIKEINSELKYHIDELLTPIFKEGVKKGIVTKGSLIRGKKFTHYSWAIIQAFEKHFLKEGYKFSRYAVEFPGTDYEVHSIRFKAEKFSVSIIYGNKFPLPYIMYHDYEPRGGLKGIKELGKRKPEDMINWSRDIHKRRGPIKRYKETDFWNNRESLVTIYEPSWKILDEASRLSKKVGYGISAWNLKGRYINAFRKSLD